MLELALSLTLLGGAPESPASHLRLVPSLSLSQPGAPAPDLAPRPPGAQRRPSRVGQVLLSSGGFLLGDGVAGTFFVLALVSAIGDAFEGRVSRGTEELFYLGVATWLLLPPALGVAGATAGGAPRERWGRAYWIAFFVLVAAGAAAIALADRGLDGPAAVAVAGTDLVLAPLVIVRVLGGVGPPAPAPAAALPSPAQLALPVR